MNYPTKKLLLLLCIMLFSAACSGNNPSPSESTKPAFNYSHKLEIGKEILLVEIVSDEKKMQTGLSNREKLDDNNGMLFDFGNKKVVPNFWMKDMLFDIDIIWIADKKIIGITPNVPAPIENLKLKIENLPVYSPPAQVDQVLEVNAGWSEKNKIKVGDEVQLVN
ncbi:MAG: DUF192 domain-containing protein [Candidatus Doudnabacteria bacterium]|jgi:hypothetical protein